MRRRPDATVADTGPAVAGPRAAPLARRTSSTYEGALPRDRRPVRPFR
ncbi:hypothetical protein Ae706Ps2_1881 [Pseudonocardia sp. Ae706_Ps2]|nr:hypothetical protein Ae706Ps2_1881 [Pseudonocardia sp. Ae706_Ps2]